MDGTDNADVSMQQAGQSGQIEQTVDASQQEQAQGQQQFVSRDEFMRVLQEQERRIQGFVDKNVQGSISVSRRPWTMSRSWWS